MNIRRARRWMTAAALAALAGSLAACNNRPPQRAWVLDPKPPADPPPAPPPPPDPAALLAAAKTQRYAAGTSVDSATSTLRQNEANPPESTDEAQQSGRDADRQQLTTATAVYKQALATEVVATIAPLDANAQAAQVGKMRSEAMARLQKIEADASAFLNSRLTTATSDGERTQIYATMESMLAKARAEVAVLDEVGRRLQATGVAASDNATRLQLEHLLKTISSNFVEEPRRPDWNVVYGRFPTQTEREVEEWLRRKKLEADLQQFMWLAENGVFLNLSTGQPITGELRDRIAKNAKLQIATALQQKGYTAGAIRTLFGWTDSRLGLAAQIEQGVRGNNWYSALAFIRPSMAGATPRETFLAFAHVLRQSADDVHKWRGQLIPEGGMGGVGGKLYELFVAKRKAGLGLATRISGGEIAAQDQRIADFEAELSAVVQALTAAANTTEPKELGATEHDLLKQFGFIVDTSGGREQYAIPSGNVTGALKKDLNLLGSTLLDIISAENAINIVILAGAPQVAAARAGMFVEGLGGSELAVAMASFAANTMTGAGLDAASQIYFSGTVQWDRLMLDNAALGVAMPAAGAIGVVGGKQLAALFKDPEKRKLAETALTQALGLTGETAIQTYWQAQVEGRGVTFEDFLSSLFSNTFGRGLPGVATFTGKVREDLQLVLGGKKPEWFPAELANNPALRDEWDAATIRESEVRTRLAEANDTILKILGDDANKEWGDSAVVSKVTNALESGELTFVQLKLLFGNDEKRLTPLLAEIKEHRTRLFTNLVDAARADARQAIETEYAVRLGKLTAALSGDPAELARATAETASWREQNLKLVGDEVKAPGSKDLTSDMDRSSPSPFLRNSLRKIVDRTFAANGGLPPTSAKAYDVNEYFLIFNPIDRARDAGVDVSSVEVSISGGNDTVSQATFVEAESLAGAMMHMTPEQRARRRQNAIQEVAGDPKKLKATVVLFELADRQLRKGREELQAEIRRLAGEGYDPNDPDTVTRARDNLYGRRQLEIGDKELRLQKLDATSQAYRELAAEIERDWNFANREGIEMYTTHTSIYFVVMAGQLVKKSTREQIADGTFTAPQSGFVLTFTGFHNDQVMLIAEHVNAFHEGHESAAQAATALAKYAERVVGGLHGQGIDITQGKAKELSDIAATLMAVRKEPAKLVEALAAFGGTADQGVDKLAGLLEDNLPGMKGVFDPALLHGSSGPAPTGVAVGPSTGGPRGPIRAFDRDRQQELDRDLVMEGPDVVAERAAAELTLMERDVASLEAQQANNARLAQIYRPQDRAYAATLEDELVALIVQRSALPNQSGADPQVKALDTRIFQTSSLLDQMKAAFKKSGAAPTPENIQRATRLANLKDALGRQRELVADLKLLADTPVTVLDDIGVLAPIAPIDPSSADFVAPLSTPTFFTVVVNPNATMPVITWPGTTLTPGATPTSADTFVTLSTNNLFSLNGQMVMNVTVLDPMQLGGATTNGQVVPVGGNPSGSRDLIDRGLALSRRTANPLLRALLGLADWLGPSPAGARADLARSTWSQGNRAGSAPRNVPATIYFTSLGRSTGDAFTMTVLNHGQAKLAVSADHFVLQPLAKVTEVQVAREVARHPAQARASVTVGGYCLQFLKEPPVAGTIFRLADPATQQRFRSFEDVLTAARFLESFGQLPPDGPDAKSYGESIRQWAIWTEEQRFTEATFTAAFLAYTKKNVQQAGREWTPTFDQTIRRVAPGRWRAIQTILEQANRRRQQK